MEIALETRCRNKIPNYQSNELAIFESNQFDIYKRKYILVNYRTAAIPFYNCHGMTFASRRTGIHDINFLRKILEDDGYIEVSSNEIKEGDVALYYSRSGDIEHSGIVVETPKHGGIFIPRIYSKWGKGFEVVHSIAECPYDATNVKYYRIIR
jgi:hypothetical protein